MARPPSQELECEDLRNRYFSDYYDFGYGYMHNMDFDYRRAEINLRYEKFKISMEQKLPRLNKHKMLLVAYYGPTNHSLYTEAHLPTAENEANVDFVHLPNKCLEEIHIFNDTRPQIVMFRDFKTVHDNKSHPKDAKGDDIHIYTGSPDHESFMEWFKPRTVPTFFEF